MIELRPVLSELVRPNDIDRVVGQIEAFEAEFLRWNDRINLSAARELRSLREHVIDCVQIAPLIPDGPCSVVDVGAGGGLPGVLIAILRPLAQVVSLEPVNKKVSFMKTAARVLAIENHVAMAERSERHARRDYDVAVSRATMDISVWLDHGETLVRPGGSVIGFEGMSLATLGARDLRVPLAAGEKVRSFVVRRAR